MTAFIVRAEVTYSAEVQIHADSADEAREIAAVLPLAELEAAYPDPDSVSVVSVSE